MELHETKKPGQKYEDLLERIYRTILQEVPGATVEKDVKLTSNVGSRRQFDLVIRTRTPAFEILTVVEAKKYSRPVDVEKIEAFVTKMRGVKANKGLMVSPSGFQDGADRVAREYGIDLCQTFEKQRLRDLVREFPVVIHFLPLRLSISARLPPTTPHRNGVIDYSRVNVNGKMALEVFREHVLSGDLRPYIRRPLSEHEKRLESDMQVGRPVIDHDRYEVPMNVWRPNPEDNVRYTDKKTRRSFPVEDLVVRFNLIYEYYFAYLSELPGTVALKSITAAREDVFYDPEDFLEFKSNFKKFRSMDEIPVTEAMNFHVLEDIGSTIERVRSAYDESTRK